MTRNQTGAIEPIEAAILDVNNLLITGLSDIVVSIRRISDDYFLDFSDNIFKNTGWITRQQTLTEVDLTNAPGEYSYSWDTSLITNETANDTYAIRVDQEPLDQVANTPQFGEIKAGQYVDNIDAAITTRATPTQVKTQADQALVDYDPPTGAELAATEAAIRGSDSDDLKTISDQIDGVPATTDVVLTAAHGSGSWVGLGSPTTIADAVWNALFASYESTGTMGLIMKMIRALISAEMEQDPTANEWIVKDPDTGLSWFSFDTVNIAGDPASVNVYKRIPK